MDFDYMGQLLLSVAIFAPGLVLLTLLAFVGLLVMIEKAGFFGQSARRRASARQVVAGEGADARNPAPGRIVSDLTDAIAAEAGGESETEAAEADIRHIGNSG